MNLNIIESLAIIIIMIMLKIFLLFSDIWILSIILIVIISFIAEEYRNLTGEEILYRKFGYKTLEDFMKDIPDTVERIQ